MQIVDILSFKWMKESNRMLHFKYAIIPSILFTMIFGVGLAFGMEFKDKQYGGKFDWLDLISTVFGSIVGQLIQIILIIIIILIING